MKYSVIIPAHNEEPFVALTLQSVTAQTILPVQVVVVDDNSADRTSEIVQDFAADFAWITLVRNISDATHLPGSKVIRAFQKGYQTLNKDVDIIVKLDADLILPADYFESVLDVFAKDPRAGIVGGFAAIEKEGKWVLENLTDKDHIRGAFKAYRKECFEDIGGLRPAMGWDTVDELLAKYYNWKVITVPGLMAKHLKPTGANYNKAARYKQGEAFYALGYGFLITAIASFKLAMMKKKPLLFVDYLAGFAKAKTSKKPLLVTQEQAAFIRKYRWEKMKSKLF
ncbi:MAG TPA: glycosyltransferase family A protein [Flavobacterium sp.]|jgi:glycosyltransferase involved in cell wall biosynthesis